MTETQDPDIVPAREEEICLCCHKVFTMRNGCVQFFLCKLWAHVKCSVSEFNEFKPRLKSPQNWVQLSAGLNFEKLNTNLSGTNKI